MNRNELYHHGIKGMRWGVRKDRQSGKKKESRYKRGARYSAEYDQVKSKEYSRLKEVNKAEFDKYYDEACFLAKKYGLDMDDGGGGDSTRFSQKQLDDAGKRYMELFDKAEYLDDKLAQQSKTRAKTYITEKYGDMAIKDINHFNNMNLIGVTSAFMAVYAGLVVTSAVLKNKKK